MATYNIDHAHFSGNARVQFGNQYTDSHERFQDGIRQEDAEYRLTETDRSCLNALDAPDPQDDLARIMRDKGGLLPECCSWVSDASAFTAWLEDPERRVFWITGGPGKGKTMLLCDIIQRLKVSSRQEFSFFYFCEASKSNSGDSHAAALQSLIKAIVIRKKRLVSHVREAWEANNQLFRGANAPFAARRILQAILSDQAMKGAILCVDALDECGNDLPELLDLIKAPSTVKWIVSSRSKTPSVDTRLIGTLNCFRLSLDDSQESVSTAVDTYIKEKVKQMLLPDETKQQVETQLKAQASGTFLWVALVCKELGDVALLRHNIIKVLQSLPPGLDSLYKRMMETIRGDRLNRTYFEEILSIVLVAKRPITLEEFLALSGSPSERMPIENAEELRDMVDRCHFLQISPGTNSIIFVHKSAKDYLLEFERGDLPRTEINLDIFQECIKLMSHHLRRDMWKLNHPGASKTDKRPNPDPLEPIAYSCVFWIDHLDVGSQRVNLGLIGLLVQDFLGRHFLHWTEALSLLGALSEGVLALQRLKEFAVSHEMRYLTDFSWDAYRFFLNFRPALEETPLQTYVSPMIFSPRCSLIKAMFKDQALRWIESQSYVESEWPPYLQAFEYPAFSARVIAYSEDSLRLISASPTDMIITDAATGACLRKVELQGDRSKMFLPAPVLSRNGTQLAQAFPNPDNAIYILDTTDETWVEVSEAQHKQGHSNMQFSERGDRLASWGRTSLKIWNVENGKLIHEFERADNLAAPVFLGDSSNIALYSSQGTIQVWCTDTGELRQELEGDGRHIHEIVAFPSDHSRLISISNSGDAIVWEIDAKRRALSFSVRTVGFSTDLKMVVVISDNRGVIAVADEGQVSIYTLSEGTYIKDTCRRPDLYPRAMAISPSSKLLAVLIMGEIIIWDVASCTVALTLQTEDYNLQYLTFSPDSQFLVSLAQNAGVEVALPKTFPVNTRHNAPLEGNRGADNIISGWTDFVSISKDGRWLATHFDSSISLWRSSGKFERLLVGVVSTVRALAFSWNSSMLAFCSGKILGICNVSSDPPVQHQQRHDSAHREILAFSKDDKYLAACTNRSIQVINTQTSTSFRIRVDDFGNDEISDATYMDESYLMISTWSGLVGVLNAQTGEFLYEIAADLVGQGLQVDTCYLGYSEHIVSGSQWGLRVLEFPTGNRLVEVKTPSTPVDWVDVSPDNNAIVSTNLGKIDLNQFSLSQTSKEFTLKEVHFHGYGLLSNWISKDGKPIIWLPPEYRPHRERDQYRQDVRGILAIGGSQIAIICKAGKLLQLKFSEDPSHFWS